MSLTRSLLPAPSTPLSSEKRTAHRRGRALKQPGDRGQVILNGRDRLSCGRDGGYHKPAALVAIAHRHDGRFGGRGCSPQAASGILLVHLGLEYAHRAVETTGDVRQSFPSEEGHDDQEQDDGVRVFEEISKAQEKTPFVTAAQDVSGAIAPCTSPRSDSRWGRELGRIECRPAPGQHLRNAR